MKELNDTNDRFDEDLQSKLLTCFPIVMEFVSAYKTRHGRPPPQIDFCYFSHHITITFE